MISLDQLMTSSTASKQSLPSSSSSAPSGDMPFHPQCVMNFMTFMKNMLKSRESLITMLGGEVPAGSPGTPSPLLDSPPHVADYLFEDSGEEEVLAAVLPVPPSKVEAEIGRSTPTFEPSVEADVPVQDMLQAQASSPDPDIPVVYVQPIVGTDLVQVTKPTDETYLISGVTGKMNMY